jgi:iron(III) transport system substrate-binding protein
VVTQNALENLAPLPQRYRAADSTWVATSARASVVAYNPGLVPVADLPAGVDDLLAPRWTGQLGYAPANASWFFFVTGLRLVRGEDGVRQWLTAFAGQQPQRFDSNGAILDAVAAGTVDAGLVNHYYLYERTAEPDAATYPVLVAASDKQEAARRAVAFLLSPQAQQHLVDETGEYPVLEELVPTRGYSLASLTSLSPPDVDLADLASLGQTEAMLQEVGLL